MILPLRRRHRRTITALALLLPLGVFAALALRPVFPVSKTSASELLGREADPDNWPPRRSWEQLTVPIGLARRGDRRWVELWPYSQPLRPDVLVYVTPVDGELEDGFLLGALAGGQLRRFPLPPDLDTETSIVVFYSLALDEILGTQRFP